MRSLRTAAVLVSLVFFLGCSDDDVVQPTDLPEFVDTTLTHDSLQRRYILHIPESYDGTKNVPLVVFLHGGGGNAQTAQGFTNFNEVSDANGFLIAYPQAYVAAAADSYVWADGRGLAPDILGIDDVGFIDTLVIVLQQRYRIDPSKIYLCGFSNGSFLTQRIAFEQNQRFAAVGTIGGTMNQDLFEQGDPSRSIPMIYIFGTEDPLVPYDGGYVSGRTELQPVKGVEESVAFWRSNNNCAEALNVVNVPDVNVQDVSRIEMYQYTNCDCNADVTFYKVIGAGHTWPGVPLPYAHSFGGTNLDIEAGVELWKFFDRFRKCD